MKYDKTVFSERLKAAMESSRINSKELSKKIGVSPSCICRYLSGEIIPRIDKIYSLSEVLNVDPKWLLGMDDANTEATSYLFCPWCGRRLRG